MSRRRSEASPTAPFDRLDDILLALAGSPAGPFAADPLFERRWQEWGADALERSPGIADGAVYRRLGPPPGWTP